MRENSGQEEFRFKFLHTEWLIGVRYEQRGPAFLSTTSVMVVTDDKAVVKASVRLSLHTHKPSHWVDDWSGSVDEDLITHWSAVSFESGQARVSQPHCTTTPPLIGTTILLEAEFRLFGVLLPDWRNYVPAESIWQQAVKDLFLSNTGSDIVLVAEGTKFPAHQFVLTCRSQYFRGHLTHDPQAEIQLNATAGAAKELIRFMYTDGVDRMDDVAHDLLQLADYYDIPDLVTKCAEFLIHNLNAHNVIKVIDYANRAGLHELEAAAVRTFIHHMDQEGWKAQFASLSVPAQLIIRQLMSPDKQKPLNGLKPMTCHSQMTPSPNTIFIRRP